MIKKISRQAAVAAAMWISLAGAALAAVNVNTADEAALTTLKGVGPATAKRIIDERSKNGPFKDPTNLAERVAGIGPKSAASLQEAGMTFDAKAAPAPAPAAKATKPAAAKAAR